MADGERITQDLGLAAYLSLTWPLKRITRDGSKSLFVFESSPELEAEALRFLSRQARVEPCSFWDQIRTLKGGGWR